jgi:alpha-L-fucosidase
MTSASTRIASLVLGLLASCSQGPALQSAAELGIPAPTAVQLGWQQAELGVVFHYDLHVGADGRYNQRQNRVTPIVDTSFFQPDELDTDQWVRAAKAAGARFAILTASHETGFRLWQSDANPFCMKALEWGEGKRDILAEFHASCLKYGLKPGVYLGTRWNSKLGVYDFQVTERSTISQAEYNRLIEAEVLEICTRYGDWFEFWFDGGAHGPEQGGPDLLPIVAKHQPGAVFYHSLQRADARWGGSESGMVPYPCWASFPYPVTGAGESAREAIAANGFALLKHGDPEGEYWLPAMSDAPLRGHGGHEWFWEPNDEHIIYPLEKLVDMYCRSVGHNSTLILGLTPDDRGLLPEADVTRLREWGEAIDELFAHPVAELQSPEAGAVIELSIPSHQSFSLVVLQEDIRHGERTRRYELQARRDGIWQTIDTGSCIGHKRIHRFAEAQSGEALRLVVHESIGTPVLLSMAAFAGSSEA